MTTTTGDTEQLERASLTDLDKRMLEFARARWNFDGAKEAAIRELFGLNATRFYQRLNTIIDMPGAVVFDPVTVNRLRRIRDQKRAARSLRA